MKISLALLFLIFSSAATAEDLRWGADVGIPFVFINQEDPGKVMGFEVDVVNALAKELNRRPVHVQNKWEGLVQGLKRNDYDIVVNGLEITEDRKQVVNFSIPYYITYEQLTVRAENHDIRSLADCKNRKVGTLRGSLAARILQEHPDITTLGYDAESYAFNDLSIRRIDAVLLDAPLSVYYALPNPMLKNVGEPVGNIDYGIAVRKDDKVLLEQVNAAIERLIANGTLREIYERWNLWNPVVAKAWNQDPQPKTEAIEYKAFVDRISKGKTWKEKISRYISFLPLLGKGAWLTFQLSVIAMCLAIFVGLCATLMRLYGPTLFSYLAVAYVEVFRGTPLLIQLFLIFYGLPLIGIKLEPFAAAVLGLGLNYGAAEAENYRAGILAVPKHQMEAAQALGMSLPQSIRHVILPQALKIMLPPATNDFIALLKDSSLVSIITMVELTTIYSQLAATYFDYLGIGLLTAAVYFLIGLPFVRLSRYLEKRLARERRPIMRPNLRSPSK